MLEQKKERFKKIEIFTGKTFSKVGLTPNQYTLLSLFFVFLSFYFLIKTNLILAAVFLILASILDFIDGAVARITERATKKGAYLDTICDRYVEGVILLGFLFLPLSSFIFPASIWIFLAFFGSLMTTYSKAAAKEKGLVTEELKLGLVDRSERLILITLAIIAGIFNFAFSLYLIIILAILSNITAIYRIYFNLK